MNKKYDVDFFGEEGEETALVTQKPTGIAKMEKAGYRAYPEGSVMDLLREYILYNNSPIELANRKNGFIIPINKKTWAPRTAGAETETEDRRTSGALGVYRYEHLEVRGLAYYSLISNEHFSIGKQLKVDEAHHIDEREGEERMRAAAERGEYVKANDDTNYGVLRVFDFIMQRFFEDRVNHGGRFPKTIFFPISDMAGDNRPFANEDAARVSLKDAKDLLTRLVFMIDPKTQNGKIPRKWHGDTELIKHDRLTIVATGDRYKENFFTMFEISGGVVTVSRSAEIGWATIEEFGKWLPDFIWRLDRRDYLLACGIYRKVRMEADQIAKYHACRLFLEEVYTIMELPPLTDKKTRNDTSRLIKEPIEKAIKHIQGEFAKPRGEDGQAYSDISISLQFQNDRNANSNIWDYLDNGFILIEANPGGAIYSDCEDIEKRKGENIIARITAAAERKNKGKG